MQGSSSDPVASHRSSLLDGVSETASGFLNAALCNVACARTKSRGQLVREPLGSGLAGELSLICGTLAADDAVGGAF